MFQIMRTYNQQHDKPLDFETALNNRIAMSLMSLGLNQLSAPVSGWRKMLMVGEILRDNEYHYAVHKLRLKYFPSYWKTFYLCAKYRVTAGVFILLLVIRKILSAR